MPVLPQLAPRVVGLSQADIEQPYAPPIVARALAFALPVTFVSWSGVSLYLSMVPGFLAATLHARDPIVGALVISAVQLAGIVAVVARRTIVPARDGVVAPLVVVLGLIALVAGTSLHGAAGWVLVGVSTVCVGAAGALAFATAIVIATRVCRGQRARVFARLYVAAYLAFSLPALTVGIVGARSSLLLGFGVVIVVLAALVAALPALRAHAALEAVPA
jgi:hypothetical protein